MINSEVNTLWTKLQGEGSPLTYTLEKLRACKCIFCTVFPCQICTGLHEIYSYALLTKREVEMAEFFCYVFMDRYEVEVHKRGKSSSEYRKTLEQKLYSKSTLLIPTVQWALFTNEHFWLIYYCFLVTIFPPIAWLYFVYKNTDTTENPSNAPMKGLTQLTSALKLFYGGQFTLWSHLTIRNYHSCNSWSTCGFVLWCPIDAPGT